MFGQIPIPGNFGEGFAKGAGQGTDIISKILELKRAQELLPAQKKLLEAQGLEAAQNAAWTANLIGPASQQGGQAQPQGTGSQPNYDALQDYIQNLLGGNGGMANAGSPNQTPQGNAPNDFSALQGFIAQGSQSRSAQPQGMSQAPQGMQSPQNNSPYPMEIISPGNPNLEHLNAYPGIKGIPDLVQSTDNNGNLITKYPNGKVTRQHIGPTAAQQELSKGLASADVKNYEESALDLKGLAGLEDTTNELKAIYDLPKFKAAIDTEAAQYGTTARNIQWWYLVNSNNPQVKDLAGRITTLTGNLIRDMASQFKGQFRIGEQTLIQNLKPAPNDPYWVAQGKLAEIQRTNDFAINYRTKMMEKIRSGLSSEEAFKQTRKELDVEKFNKSLEESAKEFKKAAVENEKTAGSVPAQYTPKHNETRTINGIEYNFNKNTGKWEG